MEATYERPEVLATYQVDELTEEAAVCSEYATTVTYTDPP
jgi:hypothetical protein